MHEDVKKNEVLDIEQYHMNDAKLSRRIWVGATDMYYKAGWRQLIEKEPKSGDLRRTFVLTVQKCEPGPFRNKTFSKERS